VSQISATLDSSTGALTFVARLSLVERFPDGAPVAIPVGTKAVIEQLNPIAPAVVQLIPPRAPGARAFLQPGDTIASERKTGAVDQLASLAAELGDELRKTLEEARSTMVRTARATTEAERLLAATTPRLLAALEKLTSGLERTDAVLAQVEPRIGPIEDSLLTVLGETRRLLRTVEQLAADATTLVADNDVTIRDTLKRLRRSAVLLEHFATEVSRRPTRLLTGVRPPSPDTTEMR
jgi:ABC-type transporter Mla subunit MlaD